MRGRPPLRNSRRKAHGGDRLGGDALAATREAELFGRRCLDADAVCREAENGRHPLDHRPAIGCDPGPLTDDSDIDRADDTTLCSHQIRGVAQELVGSGAAPARFARRKMHPDIAGADRAEYGVGQSMKADIGVGVPDKAHVVRDFDAAYRYMITRGEGVDIETLTNPDVGEP